ncbi:GBS Bsp-like repeat-containing protein [Streptococcus tangpeifui]|uniref:GBS Bsp-like repeat-containing protein n=1 Tax=Streptococcus tangpeifui TaxID=2709400 RepID=UPI0013ED0B69|nr:GBS Bsp-like repeat-containing protein [Streptococcus sp. ZJ373]
MKKDLLWSEKQRFSIRKYSFGAASVFLGASLVLGGQVLADEQTAPTSQPQDTSTQTTTVKETGTEAVTPKTDGAVREAVIDKVTQETAEKPIAVSDAEISTDEVATRETDVDNPTVPTKVDAATQTNDYTAPSEINSADQAQQAGTVTNASPVMTIQEVGKDLPSSGYYTYPERTEIKNSPSASAPLAFFANAGDRVYYDQVPNQDGYQWLSYKSYSGIRRYANIAKLVAKEVSADKPDPQAGEKPGIDSEETTLPALERYSFDKEVEVKNEAKAAAKTEFTFGEGDSISYDKILKTDGYKWISYVSYGGTRRYVMLDKLPAQASEQKTESKLSGQISVENQTDKGFDVRISNISDSNGILAVKVPIWTDKDDQDDLIWYDAVKQGDGTYKVAVSMSEHKNESGLYNIHLYYVENDGAMKGVASLQYTFSEPEKPQATRTGTLSFSNKDNGDFDVIISDVVDSQGLKAVKLPVWTDKNDQDDLVWYDAERQADGTYKAVVKLADHKNETGTYNIHLYYLENDGQLVGVAGSQHQADVKKSDNQPKAEITIQNQTSDGFDILVTNVSGNQVSAVKVPVWTDKDGQDDIVWYDATKQVNGDYKVSVKVSDHKNQHGVYNVHLYYVENDNKLVGVAGTQTTVPEPAVKPNYETTFPSLKSYTFVKQVDVRNEPRMAAEIAFTFQAGEGINYDKIMHKDGHDWISYVSYGGQRRYIVIN